ncbi:TraB/GumN family protein [Phaeobacter sp. J2-8]|uniref:TraB/GumN family protein n=1 Tax=Phaeobacter sp. J2-8 TaxID=2931394 RepID=UPI001FD02A92|nr:TraB/GumN family protein [Phaeobacter sp. J2-8]MCJ7872688.1 TraB/GumN family protein [Phaeobacter sp. J2-8]
MRLLIVIALSLLPQMTLAAGCVGSDLRTQLEPDQIAALAAAEAETPFANGNHWRATRGERVIHVIGTVHIPDPRLDPVSAKLAPLITAADRLLVEATAEDRKLLEQNLTSDSSFLLLQDTTLPELMEEEDWQKLAEAARSRGIPAFMAAKFQPWYLSLVLALPGCAMEVMGTGEGLDARIETMAQNADLARQSLEPFDTVFKMFNEDPLDEQLRMLQLGIFPEETGADLLVTTLNSYFDQAHSDSWQLSRILTLAHLDLPEAEVEQMLTEMEEKLLIRRNLAWIDVIEDAPEDRLVVAVGAAHLMGESGILNQLQSRGYTLERQAF